MRKLKSTFVNKLETAKLLSNLRNAGAHGNRLFLGICIYPQLALLCRAYSGLMATICGLYYRQENLSA